MRVPVRMLLACAKSKMGSMSTWPVALDTWKSIGSRAASGSSRALGYSPLPPMASQKPSGSSPSATSTVCRASTSRAASLLATCCSASFEPEPFHTYIVAGVSSTKQSPALSDAATSSTCTARVSYSSVPRTW